MTKHAEENAQPEALATFAVFQHGSGTPSRTERNPLKSRIKTLHWWGPDRAPTGTPLSLAFYCYVNVLDGIL
jgi:hypothetical protein